MTGSFARSVLDRVPRLARPGAVALALVLLGVGVTSCGVVNAVHKVAHALEANKQLIDSFTRKVQSGEGRTFEATYATSGSAPTTVVYAVAPPTGLAFRNSPSGAAPGVTGGVDLIVNRQGEYSCQSATSGWTCERLDAQSASAQNAAFGFYTPDHWVAFLKGFALTAGFAGDELSVSNKTVNGFAMDCFDFVAPGVPGTSTICTTAQGILGYVKVASDSTTFELKSYSTSPPASLFALPPGAKVSTVQVPTTT